MKTRISPGQFYASNNQEVVRVISYKAPTVRYAQASYGGEICKTTDAAFLDNYRHISEERATQLLRGPGPSAPKTIVIPDGAVEKQWQEAEAHLAHKPYEIDGIKFGAVKDDLIAARQNIERGNLSGAILHMKWAVEKLLPEGQQYCSQTLDDTDPEKTIQGYLDNIVASVGNWRKARETSDTPAIDALYGSPFSSEFPTHPQHRKCQKCGAHLVRAVEFGLCSNCAEKK